MDDLARLAELMREKHLIDAQIAALVGRPAQIGHVGEYIASRVSGITLEHSAVAKGIDGYFASGPLAGRSVNVKWYAKLEGLLDITPKYLPDDYLVLAGPRTAALSSRGGHRPWLVNGVYLFDAHALAEILSVRGVKIGIATSVARQHWDAAEVYPAANNARLVLTPEQRAALARFAAA